MRSMEEEVSLKKPVPVSQSQQPKKGGYQRLTEKDSEIDVEQGGKDQPLLDKKGVQ